MQLPKFHLDDDKIYIFISGGASQGPYKIASVQTNTTPIKYSLSHADGTAGQRVLFEETRLTQQTRLVTKEFRPACILLNALPPSVASIAPIR